MQKYNSDLARIYSIFTSFKLKEKIHIDFFYKKAVEKKLIDPEIISEKNNNLFLVQSNCYPEKSTIRLFFDEIIEGKTVVLLKSQYVEPLVEFLKAINTDGFYVDIDDDNVLPEMFWIQYGTCRERANSFNWSVSTNQFIQDLLLKYWVQPNNTLANQLSELKNISLSITISKSEFESIMKQFLPISENSFGFYIQPVQDKTMVQINIEPYSIKQLIDANPLVSSTDLIDIDEFESENWLSTIKYALSDTIDSIIATRLKTVKHEYQKLKTFWNTVLFDANKPNLSPELKIATEVILEKFTGLLAFVAITTKLVHPVKELSKLFITRTWKELKLDADRTIIACIVSNPNYTWTVESILWIKLYTDKKFITNLLREYKLNYVLSEKVCFLLKDFIDTIMLYKHEFITKEEYTQKIESIFQSNSTNNIV